MNAYERRTLFLRELELEDLRVEVTYVCGDRGRVAYERVRVPKTRCPWCGGDKFEIRTKFNSAVIECKS